MKKFTFELTEQEANLAVAALGKQPYQDVRDLISNMQTQFAIQNISKPAEENVNEKT